MSMHTSMHRPVNMCTCLYTSQNACFLAHTCARVARNILSNIPPDIPSNISSNISSNIPSSAHLYDGGHKQWQHNEVCSDDKQPKEPYCVPVYRHVYRHVRKHVCRHVCKHVYRLVCVDMCACGLKNLVLSLCMIHVCICTSNMCVDLCIRMCKRMSGDMCERDVREISFCTCANKHVYRHVCMYRHMRWHLYKTYIFMCTDICRCT